jgi:Na+/H+ antiporter NhaD/arsenite permease-like protein
MVLLALSFMPMIAPKFWSKNETLVFALIAIFSIASVYMLLPGASNIILHAIIDDYVPFIIMVFTLFTLSHGIHIDLKAPPNTWTNVIFLACSSFCSSFIGTTGASVLFLKPFLTINKERTRKAHLLLFYIFLVSNIGGLLTPLGDSPLLLGYIHGVDFSWAMKNLTKYWLIYTAFCLLALYIIDKIVLKKEGPKQNPPGTGFSMRITGWLNITLLALTVLVLCLDFEFELKIPLSCIDQYIIPHIWIKNAFLLVFCVLSVLNKKNEKEKVNFTPCKDVAKTFLVIFIVIAPVLYLLSENSEAIHRALVSLGSNNDATHEYFWACALTSAFLDNAPSFLLFFNIAGGNASELMGVQSNILTAISISGVVMGAITYVGNAPNLIVRSMAQQRGIKMPSFLAYLMWASLTIIPLSLLVVHLITK